MEFLKKHWQKIVIVLFVIIFMSTCVSNCSHKNEIRTLKATYAASDSVISDLNDTVVHYKSVVKDLNRDVYELNKQNEMLQKSNADLNKALNRNVVVNIKQEKDEE